MKRILLLLISCVLASASFSQQADLKKAVIKYRNANGASANVVRIRHNAALTKDDTAKGLLTMKRPNQVSITVNGGKEQLIMNGSSFTMVANGKKRTTNSKTNPQFASFQKVFEYILSGGTTSNITQLSDLSIKENGRNIIITITPKANKKKAQRRMMFTSFELQIDSRTSALKSLRMNQRGNNYTEYEFHSFNFK